MEFMVLNTKFELVAVLDTFISAIWTDRYNTAGDFEICLPMDTGVIDMLKDMT